MSVEVARRIDKEIAIDTTATIDSPTEGKGLFDAYQRNGSWI